jgi:hypothetical protein
MIDGHFSQARSTKQGGSKSMPKRILSSVSMFVLIAMAPAPASSQGPIETFIEGCEAELTTYCKDVTPGDNRVLACIYAYSDKLSARCEYALYEAAAQLERAIAALSYVVEACREDLDRHCAAVAAGEGRLLECIQAHEKDVSRQCLDAIDEVGLEPEEDDEAESGESGASD